MYQNPEEREAKATTAKLISQSHFLRTQELEVARQS